ncbi:DUF1740-domain-containing protein [Aureobasidium sp. EXF-10728]|nr:DUF1740-domain-containing protein [Aureobasidium sp. EXF-10728]
MSAPSREVPKFSSFRAKKSAPQEQHPSLSTTRKRQPSPEHDHGPVKSHRSAERHSASSQHNSKIRDFHRRVQDQHERHEGRSSATSRPSSLVHRDDNSGLFTVDRDGDQQNASYGRLHKYSIPSYHRVGFGNILGLPPRFKIDRAESTLDKVFITDKSATSKQVPQRLLLKRQRKQELPALLMPDEHDLDLAQDFVALSPSSADCDPESMDDAFGSFRHLDPTTNSDLHNIRPQGILDVAPAADLHIRQQNVQFVRATKSNPSDLKAWLDLAKHQEYLVSPGADAQSLTNVERQTLADMRIAVYEKALKHFPDSEASSREQLVMELLHEASLAWDTQKYMQKLRDILEQHSESFPIWTLYLNACQANSIDFRFEDVKTLFMRSLRTLGSSAKSRYQSDTRKMVLYLILRHTVFLLNTGYDELSIAIWQALCEYHMCKPEHLAGHNTSQVLSDFEQFWESERPRFGEVGARGWSANPQDINVASDVQSPLKDKLDPRLPFSSFSALETNTRKFFQFPGRTMDEIGADDPFHVVFFSDIREVLEVTATGLDRYDLLDAILCYLGLPSLSDYNGTTILQYVQRSFGTRGGSYSHPKTDA